MNTRLLVDVWHGITDPWNRIGLGRLLREIDLARAQRNLSRAGRDLRVGRGFTSTGHDEARSSAPGAALSEVVIDVHSFLSPGDPLPETSAEAIATIAASEGIPVAKERLRRPPTKPLCRLTHRIVHTVHESAKDPADDVRRTPEAVIHLDDWFLGVDKASDPETPADSLT